MNLPELQALVAEGESERLEFKKSTGDLKGGMETLCAFLNGQGGKVLFGVSSSGTLRGQDVSDATLREVGNELARLEPPASVVQTRVAVGEPREVLVLETTLRNGAPYTYNGRPFWRLGSNTKLMPQNEYQRRLLERDHAQQRWENQPAAGYGIGDLDEEEIRRTVREAVDAGRLDAVVSGPAEALRKFHLLVGDQPLQAAVVAFGKEVMPNYPQCGLRLARFRGVTKTEFLDQRQLTGHAFLLLREADLFLAGTCPCAAASSRGCWSASTSRCFLPWRYARHW